MKPLFRNAAKDGANSAQVAKMRLKKSVAHNRDTTALFKNVDAPRSEFGARQPYLSNRQSKQVQPIADEGAQDE